MPEIAFRNVSGLLEPVEQSGSGRCRTNGDAEVIGQTARKILGKASSSDVSHAMDVDALAQQALNQARIQAGRFQQIPDQRPLIRSVTGRCVGSGLLQHLADQAVPVAVDPTARTPITWSPGWIV